VFFSCAGFVGKDACGVVEVELAEVVVVGDVFFLGDDALAFEDGLDAVEEFFGVEGFRDVVIGTDFEALQDIFLHGFCGEEDDGGVLVDFAYFGGQFEAVFFGHHDVEDAEVIAVFVFDEFLEAFFSIGGEIYLVVVDFEVRAQYIAKVLIVFYE